MKKKNALKRLIRFMVVGSTTLLLAACYGAIAPLPEDMDAYTNDQETTQPNTENDSGTSGAGTGIASSKVLLGHL